MALVGPEPEAASIEEQGLGWKSKFGTGKGDDAIGSGLEVIWTATPTKWSNNFFTNLFGYRSPFDLCRLIMRTAGPCVPGNSGCVMSVRSSFSNSRGVWAFGAMSSAA